MELELCNRSALALRSSPSRCSQPGRRRRWDLRAGRLRTPAREERGPGRARSPEEELEGERSARPENPRQRSRPEAQRGGGEQQGRESPARSRGRGIWAHSPESQQLPLDGALGRGDQPRGAPSREGATGAGSRTSPPTPAPLGAQPSTMEPVTKWSPKQVVDWTRGLHASSVILFSHSEQGAEPFIPNTSVQDGCSATRITFLFQAGERRPRGDKTLVVAKSSPSKSSPRGSIK
ncbi:hypothetical protein J1605_017444 [Eschrichtius robustus]|uniref:Uncharacterized protein n=1 Tax=Eschrichtius robustus TaxID=9764 RepID=A0AB34HWM0_ESCRO|nr:hypothetical protein J1605_017444 [Eschrichtius robustus]